MVDEFFDYVKLEKNKYGMHIFEMLGSLENEQYIDFGEFLKAIGTFCMFGYVRNGLDSVITLVLLLINGAHC